MNKTPADLMRNIYAFAYKQGQKVIGPRRHWRHAVELGHHNALEQDFGRQFRQHLPTAGQQDEPKPDMAQLEERLGVRKHADT